jgi:hypothetical protein
MQIDEPVIESPTEFLVLQQENKRLKRELFCLKLQQEPSEWNKTFMRMEQERENMDIELARLNKTIYLLEMELDDYYNYCVYNKEPPTSLLAEIRTAEET